MKRLIAIAGLFLNAYMASAQTIPVEVMAGTQYAYYQHGMSRQLSPGASMGWVHVASMLVRYDYLESHGDGQPVRSLPHELMSQFYLTKTLSKSFNIQLGTFYTKASDVKGSVALQFLTRGEDWTLLVKPRVNISDLNGFEGFTLFEYRPKLSQHLHVYSRVQAMSSFSRSAHQRSYQQVRLGLEGRRVQYGLALTLDQYGPSSEVQPNLGIFIRTELH